MRLMMNDEMKSGIVAVGIKSLFVAIGFIIGYIAAR